jgi:ABC-type uncharacterized transport system fused permease/ATPase subunit
MAKSGRGDLRISVVQAIASLMTAAFGLLAALAWNEAIRAAVQQFFTAGDALLGLFIYAIIVTIIAVIAIVLIGRAMGKMNIQYEKKGPV